MRAPPLDKLTDLSQSLIDDIINSINNLIYQAISGLETSLIATPPERLGFAHASNGSTIPETDEDGNVLYPEAKLELENGLHQLETLLEANVDKAFDKFEIYVLRNILTVPEDLLSWVRLKHYEVRRCNRATESSVFRIRANIFMV
jgi:kinetochore protein Mis12/MTW1